MSLNDEIKLAINGHEKDGGKLPPPSDHIVDTQDWCELEALRESLREHMAEIRRLCAGLAEPEQKPVAWMLICASGEEDDITYEEPSDRLLPGWSYRALYTHPPQRKPLTDEERQLQSVKKSC